MITRIVGALGVDQPILHRRHGTRRLRCHEMARNNFAVKFLIFEYFIGCSPVFLDNFPREVANDLLALMVPV